MVFVDQFQLFQFKQTAHTTRQTSIHGSVIDDRRPSTWDQSDRSCETTIKVAGKLKNHFRATISVTYETLMLAREKSKCVALEDFKR